MRKNDFFVKFASSLIIRACLGARFAGWAGWLFRALDGVGLELAEKCDVFGDSGGKVLLLMMVLR